MRFERPREVAPEETLRADNVEKGAHRSVFDFPRCWQDTSLLYTQFAFLLSRLHLVTPSSPTNENSFPFLRFASPTQHYLSINPTTERPMKIEVVVDPASVKTSLASRVAPADTTGAAPMEGVQRFVVI